jgi:putative addiction module component (TIGR02574 family)
VRQVYRAPGCLNSGGGMLPILSECEMSTADDVLSAALTLSPHDRAVVAERLLASLDGIPQPDAELDDLWAKEIASRAEAYRDGKVEAVRGSEAMAEVRRRLREAGE